MKLCPHASDSFISRSENDVIRDRLYDNYFSCCILLLDFDEAVAEDFPAMVQKVYVTYNEASRCTSPILTDLSTDKPSTIDPQAMSGFRASYPR